MDLTEAALGLDGPTLIVSATRENLTGLEEDFRWMAEVRASDTSSAEATPGTGADGAATSSFDTCPNLTDVDAALLGGMGQSDGTTEPAPEDVLEKLPEGP